MWDRACYSLVFDHWEFRRVLECHINGRVAYMLNCCNASRYKQLLIVQLFRLEFSHENFISRRENP